MTVTDASPVALTLGVFTRTVGDPQAAEGDVEGDALGEEVAGGADAEADGDGLALALGEAGAGACAGAVVIVKATRVFGPSPTAFTAETCAV